MDIALIRLEKDSVFKELSRAFEERNLNTRFVDIKKLSLFAGNRKTNIFLGKTKLKEINAVHLSPSLQLTQFTEPLSEELFERNIYCQLKPKSFYINSNELFQCITLNEFHVKTPKTIITGQTEGTIKAAREMNFPLLFKAYRAGKKEFAMIVESIRSLKSVVKSISFPASAFLCREFVEGNVNQALVIGEKVFNIKREWHKDALQKLGKGASSKLSKETEENAKHAARVCGCDIATVKLTKGHILAVEPTTNYLTYCKKTGEDIFGEVAELFKKKILKEEKY